MDSSMPVSARPAPPDPSTTGLRTSISVISQVANRPGDGEGDGGDADRDRGLGVSVASSRPGALDNSDWASSVRS